MKVDVFEANRGRLFSIAYGMLGSSMDAEDIVQDTYLRWREVDAAGIDSPAAYLTTITTRLAIDRLRSAQHRRETYVGPWLPEPLIGEFESDPADMVGEAESLSTSVLVALEGLTPVERAVLLLREFFDLDYVEIADVVDKSPANCRQIASRARTKVGDVRTARPTDHAAERQLLERYVAALAAADVDQLAEVFAEDVVLWADGGGQVRAARHPLFGAWRVARHLVGVAPQTPADVVVSFVRVNGSPGVLGTVDGTAVGLLDFEVVDDQITAVRAHLNPEKLAPLDVSSEKSGGRPAGAS